ncbi:hypothetical protein GBA52_002662 [Prunus armeniaca]|nr:hypothetical protein GBA52_002662 [Prunus armeniaca]
MALRIPHHLLLFTILFLSLLFLFLFHEYYNSTINLHKQIIIGSSSHTINSYSHHHHYHHHHRPSNFITRKVLASKFDFTPFVHHRQQHQRSKSSRGDHHHMQPQSEPSADGNEIDPRYGVEKRRVPTGPNPLHH